DSARPQDPGVQIGPGLPHRPPDTRGMRSAATTVDDPRRPRGLPNKGTDMNRNNEIRLTELDAARLERSLIEELRREDAPTHGTAELEALLDEAAVVPAAAIDPHVVTMNSTVVVEEVPAGHRTNLTLVYPNE